MSEKKTRENPTGGSKKPGRRIAIITGGMLGLVAVLAVCLIVWLAITEFCPEPIQDLTINHLEQAGENSEKGTLKSGDELTMLTWNVGYGALGAKADFFMDGGEMVNTATKDEVKEHVAFFADKIADLGPDVVFLQEIDLDSHRSHGVNELAELEGLLSKSTVPYQNSVFANNFLVKFIPYPLPPIGKVNAGIATLTDFCVKSAERISLPCPFQWPVRMVNLKRCLLVERIPVDNGKELVLINLHLEAYDDGEGKAAQSAMLREMMQKEADQGNYVIAGGDFNQCFSNVDFSMYPTREGMWECGCIDVDAFGDGFDFLMDNTTPSCRSLDKAYAGADKTDFQYYMLDGFIVSDNLRVETVKTLDYDFEATDHNPVLLKLILE